MPRRQLAHPMGRYCLMYIVHKSDHFCGKHHGVWAAATVPRLSHEGDFLSSPNINVTETPLLSPSYLRPYPLQLHTAIKLKCGSVTMREKKGEASVTQRSEFKNEELITVITWSDPSRCDLIWRCCSVRLSQPRRYRLQLPFSCIVGAPAWIITSPRHFNNRICRRSVYASKGTHTYARSYAGLYY